MPGLNRHVHFGGNASPASSSSSLLSSGGPVTPPPYGFVPPYYPASSPPATETNGFVNPVLSPNNPTLDFNLSQNPTSMRHYATIPATIWQQPATNPPVPSMVVVCDRLPWVLTIPGSSEYGYVSVGDFVFGLYNALSLPVSNPEFSTLSPAGQHAVGNAYDHRCKLSFDANQYDSELKKGVKRVDFLVGLTKYSGIRQDKAGKWTLLVR